MRIEKLDLIRFGKFTDYSLNFGKSAKNQPDLHIVYGPNEAGKSTIMAAYLDFLFGFNVKTPYNFKHANNVLKVGGQIGVDGESYEYRRVKKNKHSFLDSNEQPVSDTLIAQQLAGLGKDAYATMFSLDDHSLEQGGESILASKGDLGKLLYSATTGVAQLSESLLELRVNNDSFYKKGKRKFELAELKLKLKSIEAERKQLDTEAAGYSKLVKLRSEANERYQKLGSEQDQLKLQIAKLKLKQSAYPRLSSLTRLEEAIKPLASLPKVPDVWFSEIRELLKGSVEFNAREQDFKQNQLRLDGLIDDIKLDKPAISAGANWRQIEIDSETYLVASANLPEVLQQKHICEREITQCLRKLDQPEMENPQSLLLTASVLASFRELQQLRTELASQLEAAKRELASATKLDDENLKRYKLDGGSVDTNPAATFVTRDSIAIAELEREFELHSNSALNIQRDAKVKQLAELEDELQEKLHRLRPWVGTVDELHAMSPPHSSELNSLQQKRDTIQMRTSEVEQSIEAQRKTIEYARTKQKSFANTGVVDDAVLRKLRRERDEAWLKHRQTLDTATADAFELAMRADDASQTGRLENAENLAQLTQLEREVFVANETKEKNSKQLTQLQTEQNTVTDTFERWLRALSLQTSSMASIEALSDWLEWRNEALQINQKAMAAQRELDAIDGHIKNAVNALTNSLDAADISIGVQQKDDVAQFSSLLKLANVSLKRENVLSSSRDQLVASKRALNSRKDEFERASTAYQQWEDDWNALCGKCWLGSNGETPRVSVVEDSLQQLEILEQQLTEQSKLEEKSDQYQSVIDEFSQSLRSLAEALNIEHKDLSADQLFQSIKVRMEEAEASQSLLVSLQTQKEESLEKQKSSQEKHTVDLDSIARMTEHFSVSSINEVEIRLQEVKNKEDLEQRIADEQHELLNMLSVQSLADATEFLKDFDQDAIQLKLDELERQAKDLEKQLQEAHTEREEARNAVSKVGGDDAVALLMEQRANLLLEIKEKTVLYLQQHLALMAADSALNTYRDNHRSTMMKKASDAFSVVSQGRFARLETIQDAATEKLIAIDKDGDSKTSEALSKGTRFQLYLALRVAGYYEYCSTRPPVPFIADDIMETFDDERAASTFDVLSEMALMGQVIYLTHHKHLCDIAQRVVPNVRVHTLA